MQQTQQARYAHIVLTDRTVKAVKKLVASGSENAPQWGPIGLRMGVTGGSGCHGFAYTFELTDGAGEGDTVFEKDGAKVVVDEASLACIGEGAVLEHVNTVAKRGFEVLENSLADSECGCKVSFSLKTDDLLL